MGAMPRAATVHQIESDREPRISYVVARLERAIRAAIADGVRPYGITTLQYTTLSLLATLGKPVSTSQLARRAYMTPQAMSEVIAALDAKGLVQRNPDPNHGRLLPAKLTVRGRRVLTACDGAVDAMEDEMLAGLDGSDREQLFGMLMSAVRSLGAGFPRG